jgi:hypothetical protein
MTRRAIEKSRRRRFRRSQRGKVRIGMDFAQWRRRAGDEYFDSGSILIRLV